MTHLITEVFGLIQREVEITKEKNVETSGRLNAKFNFNLLSFFKIAEAVAEGERKKGKSEATTIRGDIRSPRLIADYIDYIKKNYPYPCFDAFNGVRYEEKKDNDEIVSKIDSITDEKFKNTKPEIGKVGGLFELRKISPQSRKPNLLEDIFSKKDGMWLLESLPESKIQVQIPILAGNFRTYSQMALWMLKDAKIVNIQAVGIIEWRDDKILLDPLCFGIFHP